MSKERLLSQFKDIVEPRRVNRDAVGFMTRNWVPQPACRNSRPLTPSQIKALTSDSSRLDKLLDELAMVLNRNKVDLKKEVLLMLEEIGLDRKMYVVRWLGVFTSKVLCRMCSSIFVNEKNIFHLKATMGHNPVVFVPTHRSYADFILMTYVCFFYDIELPAVAAGMDFHAMVGMGRVMRDTCAFYMRRTFASDKLYGAVFRQYVRTLVTAYHAPLEFFIEGTRSRSGKSMSPKYGFMSMVLEPFFTSEIPDVTFVPINISYDRIMEERLFAFELLGVPKPKESTSGLLKALNILNENYGNIYINVGEPFSAKEYFGASLERHKNAIKPVDIHTLSPDENKHVQNCAHEIVHRQQKYAIVTTFQMVAVALTMSIHDSELLTEEMLIDEIIILADLFKLLGGNVFDYTDRECIKADLKSVFMTHQNLIRLDKNNKLRLVNSTPFLLTDEIKSKMKGHQLSQVTMSTVIPVVMLQLYVNPVLHWCIPSAIVCLIVSKKSVPKDVLWDCYYRLRILLRHEFPVNDLTLASDFEETLKHTIAMNTVVIEKSMSGDLYNAGGNTDLLKLLERLIWPFLTCLYRITDVLIKEQSVEEKACLRTVQQSLEWHLLNKEDTHPYCLSLDTILNCIQGLVADKILQKERKEKLILYNINSTRLAHVSQWIEQFLPSICGNFNHSNPVMMEQLGILSRL